MQKRTITALPLLLVVTTASAQDGPNLLQDPHFDNAASIGTVWTVSTTPGGTVTWDGSLDHTGTAGSGSGRVSALGIGSQGHLSQCVGVAPNTPYAFGMWEQRALAGNAQGQVFWYPTGDCSGTFTAVTFNYTTTASWSLASGTATSPAGTNSALFYIGSCSFSCSENFDDAFFNTTATPVRLQQFDVQ
jgi:hypothetical protein